MKTQIIKNRRYKLSSGEIIETQQKSFLNPSFWKCYIENNQINAEKLIHENEFKNAILL